MNLFGTKKTVASVLGAFTTAIADLDEVSERELAEANRKNEEASAALTAANEARLEAARAQAVGRRLRQLVDADFSTVLDVNKTADQPAARAA